MSIPKIIHYCWFGGNPLPQSVKKCISSWKKFCPDYEIREWNEQNFDVSDNLYARQALERRGYAFVSDYARLRVLYEYGGVYLDTDVELLKPLDDLLSFKGYIGFERGGFSPSGGRIYEAASGLGMGAEAGNSIIGEMLKDYDFIPYILSDGNTDPQTCPQRNTKTLERLGLKTDNTYQIINGFHILPSDYLCPMDYITRKIKITKNTYSVHRYDGSYLTIKERLHLVNVRFRMSPLYSFLRRIKRKITGKKDI